MRRNNPTWPLRLALRAFSHGRPGERGTILLMVVGVLALLAIIAVVYATLGRADRASSATFVRQARSVDQTADIASYLAGVIGDSVTARYPEVVGNGATIQTRGYTYPITDKFYMSVRPDQMIISRSQVAGILNSADERSKYTIYSPSGDNDLPWPGWTGSATISFRDPREFGDPFLATFRPTFLGMSNGVLAAPMHDFRLASQRDWLNISNFAPSGNFVNLANLRGNFNAPHGFAQDGQLSFGLTLFSPITGRSYNHDANPASSLQFLPYKPGTPAADIRKPHPLIPADWCTNQVFAFRPAVPEARTDSGAAILPSSYEYLLNQWCDADGDGFIDSRWFALDRIEDFDIANTGDAIVRSVIPANTRYRWFVAARAVDSSAMLNVNVATDYYNGPLAIDAATIATTGLGADDPGNFFAPGLTPAEVDLARLLTMNDAFTDAQSDTILAGGLNFNALGYFPNTTAASPGDPDDYRNYRQSVATPDGDLIDAVGRSAFRSIMDFRWRGLTKSSTNNLGEVPPMTFLGPGIGPTDAQLRREYFERSVLAQSDAGRFRDYVSVTTGMRTNGRFSIEDDLELRRFWGINDPDSRSLLESALGGRYPNQNKFSPLRDNRSFDIEFKGRDADRTELFPIGTNPILLPAAQTLFASYGDVRQYLTTLNGARQIKDSSVAPSYVTTAATNSNFLSTSVNPNAGWARYAGPTGRPDVTRALRAVQAYRDDPTGMAGTGVTKKAEYEAALQIIFSLYADVLVPYTDSNRFPNAWNSNPDTWADTITGQTIKDRFYINGLAYGGSPELATMMAAWMTANLVDMYDREQGALTLTPGFVPNTYDESTPTAISVELLQTAALPAVPTGSVTNTSLDPVNTASAYERAYPHPKVGLLPQTRRPTNPTDDNVNLRQNTNEPSLAFRKNFYGIEPQPFMTEVSVYSVFTDSPDAAGGDRDEAPSGSGPGGVDGERQPSTPEPVTIKLEPAISNTDFLCEIIAFQLNNPFNSPIVLFDNESAPPSYLSDQASRTASAVRYYFEYANRYYIPAEQEPDMLKAKPTQRITLEPGETRTFYVINPGTLEQMWRRFRNSLETAPPPYRLTGGSRDGTLVPWLKGQFGENSVQMVQVFPDSLDPVPPVSTINTARMGQQDEMDLWGEKTINAATQSGTGYTGFTPINLVEATNAERKVAQLWRVMRATGPTLNTSDQTESGSSVTFERNLTDNDYLVDRLRDPSNLDLGTLFAHRPLRDPASPNGSKIGGTRGGDETSTSPTRILDNSGFSAIIWAAMRRPSDRDVSVGGTRESDGKPTRGVFPPWCLEVKSDSDNDWNNSRSIFSLNDSSESPVNDAGRKSNYTGGDDRFETLQNLITRTTLAQAANKNIGKNMPAKTTQPIPTTPMLVGLMPSKTYREVAVEYHALEQEPVGSSTINNRPQVVKNPMLFSRSGDFLLPLAIGPMYDPSLDYTAATSLGTSQSGIEDWITSGDAKIAKRETQWLTLSEALALASGYYNPVRQDDPLRNFALRNLNKPVPDEPKTHRGHLRLDAFTPYYYPPNSPDTPSNGGILTSEDSRQPLGAGVPFALSVIDQFRAAIGVGSTHQVVNTGTANEVWPRNMIHRMPAGGGPTQLNASSIGGLVPGLMNINTMSTITLRTLPMLTPDNEQTAWMRKYTRGTGAANQNFYNSVTNDPANPGATHNWDIAAGIEVFRDKSVVRKRGLLGQAATTIDAFASGLSSRAAVTGIRGIREQRGFKSVGDLLAVNFGDYDAGGPALADPDISMFIASPNPNPAVQFTPTSPESWQSKLGEWPEVSSSRFFQADTTGKLDSTAVDTVGSVQYHKRLGGQVMNGYQDKLAVINAVSNTVSVRSDIFTVYFVVHGYAPEDVTDLADDQPMVPSIAKRFVMIVDRSNVVSPGDKAKIVMIKELPIR